MHLSLKTETVMWLLPIVFMFHDLEEIIMAKPWLAGNADALRRRFPRLASRLLPHFEHLSTSAFALAVAEEFVILTGITLLAVEFRLYALWGGVLVAFFIHLVVHVAQFGVYRGYVPAAITSVPAGVYCVAALYALSARGHWAWPEVARWAAVGAVALVVNLAFAHSLASRFQRWLNGTRGGP